ncbi:MAG: c-type cytochrome [Bryobacteraceae bacterium]
MTLNKKVSLTTFALSGVLVFGLAATVRAGGAGDAAKGKDVFEGNMCAQCHNITGAEGGVGPTMKGLFKRKTLKNGSPVSDASVLAQINKGGGGMPPYETTLSADDKANVLAYLHSL